MTLDFGVEGFEGDCLKVETNSRLGEPSLLENQGDTKTELSFEQKRLVEVGLMLIAPDCFEESLVLLVWHPMVLL